MVLSGLTGFNIETDNISGKTFFEFTAGFKGIELDLSLRNYIEPTSGFKGLYIEHIPYPQQLNVIKKFD